MNSSTRFKPQILSLILTFCVLTCSNMANAQSKYPVHAIQMVGGYSKHGSGDMNGIIFGAEYIKYVNRRVSLNYNFRASINDGKDEIIVNDLLTGTRTDASVRFTTAGVQLGVNGGLSFVRTTKHEFMISLGAFGRYQSASNGTDGYALYQPHLTGQPTVLIGFDNRSPQETFSFGGIFQLHYNYSINNKVFVGLSPGFQTDTNADVIPQVALTIGRHL
jgi:hypothetical protein